MSSLRVLVAGLPDSLLLELVAQAAASRPGVTVSTCGPDGAETATAAATCEADAVIVRLPDDDLPVPCRRLLESRPGAAVVGLVADGRRAVLCLHDVGIDQLLGTIRAATLRRRDARAARSPGP